MTDHVTEWLGAYHDGELSGARLRQVEGHLKECTVCQAGLDEIQALSAMLQADAPVGDFLPAERFVANLILSLPRPSEAPQPRRALNTAWWLFPAGLIGAWLFVSITLSFSSMVNLAMDWGLLGSDLAGFQGNPFQMGWFSTALTLFGNQLGVLGWEALTLLNDANVFVARLARMFIPQLVLAAAYLGWLISWWLRHQAQPSQNVINSPHS